MASELDIIRQQQAAFARFSARALGETSLDALLVDACIRARAGTGSSHAKVLEYLPQEDRLLLRSGVGWKPGYVGVYTTTADVGSAIGYAFNLCEPVAVTDYGAQSKFRWPELLSDHGCVSSVNVPLRGETGVFGVLEVDHREVRTYTSDDIHFLSALGDTIARAVELHRVQRSKDQALAQKDLLMREMNHRIKNNLSLVASMLSLQSRRFTSVEIKREFEDAISRVSTLAHVHDRLQHRSPDDPDAAAYFADMCGMLHSLVPKSVRLTCHAQGVLPADGMEPLALLVNELVTNASKYAFPAGGPGELQVTFEGSGTAWKLAVRDNGIGMPPGFDVQNAQSFGMMLIRTFATQLNATVEYQSDSSGTLVEVASSLQPGTTAIA